MEVKRIKQISLIWVVTSLTALSSSQNIPNITNLFCLNDYQKKMFCSWETVGSSSNCSEDFALTYEDFKGIVKRCQDLQNEQIGGSPVPNKCICSITVDFFIADDTYTIKVESHGRLVDSITMDIASTVQPAPPYNVRIDFQEEDIGLVQWDIGYDHNFIQNKLSFHVQILDKHSREVAKQDVLTRLEPRYTFSKRQLKRREDYVVRVRMKPAEHLGFKGNWSDWSSEAEWRNDYSLTLHDLKNIIISITCISMLCLIIVNYLCFIRYKEWLHNIPTPAKSKLFHSKLEKEPLNPDGKSAAKTSCESFFTRIVKAHKSKCDKLTQQQNAEDYINICYYTKKAFFEPEDEDIERCVKMYLLKENPVEVDKREHKAEDYLLGPGDLSIAKMFLDILCDTSGKKVDTVKNFNTGTSFGCLGWMDRVGKKESQRCSSHVSMYRESGYNSFGSDDCPSDIDGLNTSYFEQWSDNERDAIPYTPPVSIKEICLNQKEWDHFESPGYNNFTSAMYDDRKYLFTDQPKTISLDGVSNNIVICNNNSHNRLLTPKSILYYNTKNIFSHNENSFQSIINPKSEQIPENTFKSYESRNNPISMCHVSRYQSFEQAVQENDAELACHTSGYKSFDQSVLEGEPDSGCQVSGYQSFDQAVQEGDVTSLYQVTGYESFDQVVQQNDESGSINCSVGYRPLEDLIKDGFKNDGQYQLEESHFQNNEESLQTEKFIDEDNSNNKIINSTKHKLTSSGETQIWLEDFANVTKEKPNAYEDFSEKSLQALKIAVDIYLDNDLAGTPKKAPLALTFDICEHLRNLDNLNLHKGSFNSLILPCHVDEIRFIQEQLTINKYLTRQKCPSTKFDTFENLAYFVPLCDLEALDSSQPLLIQQINVDMDGNSYMKLALT